MSHIDPRRPVDVFAACTVDTPAGRIAIDGSGQSVAVSADSLATLRFALSAGLRGHDRPESLRRLGSALRIAGLSMSVRVGRREIASIGEGVSAGLLSLALALPGVRLRPIALVRAFVGNL